MTINKINIDKITKTFELVCPLYKQNLITQAFIVGSVAKGSAKEDSDIDVYLINPDFINFHTSEMFKYDLLPEWRIDPDEYEGLSSKEIELYFKSKNKLKSLSDLTNYLMKVREKTELIKSKEAYHYYWFYKGEKFHLIIDYESESIKNVGEYIEITEELCNEINEIE